MLDLIEANYRCTGCGDCCRGWNVPLHPGEADAFHRLAAGLVPAERLGRAVRRVQGVEALAGAGGQCVALADDQRCLIHATHGGDQKPRACRIFPFTFVQTSGGVRVGLSFACPAVVDGEGPTLSAQRAEVEALFASAVDGTRNLLPAGEEVVLADAVAEVFDGGGTFVERVCRAGAVCALSGTGLRLDEARAGAAALAREALAEPPSVDRLSRAMFRTLLKATEPPRGAVGRVATALSSILGLGGGVIRLRGVPPAEVRWADAESVAPGLDEASEALLRRWFGSGLRALTFFGEAAFGLPLAAGLDLRVLSAAVAVYLARAAAAAAGRQSVALDDLKRGLRQLDAGLTHRATMPPGFARALAATASLDLLRTQLNPPAA